MHRALLALILLVVTPVHSDLLSISDGQAFDQNQFQELSLDLAGRTGASSQRFGARVTLPRFLNHYAFFVEAGSSKGEWDDLAVNGDTKFSGTGNGAGFYFSGIPQWKNINTALRFSYHEDENNIDTPIVVSGRVASVDQKQQSFAVRALFSPTSPTMDNGLTTYAALGLVGTRSSRRVNVNPQEETRLARNDNAIEGYFAAGIVYPTNRLRLYAVMELQEELSLSLGVRWHITKTAKKESLE